MATPITVTMMERPIIVSVVDADNILVRVQGGIGSQGPVGPGATPVLETPTVTGGSSVVTLAHAPRDGVVFIVWNGTIQYSDYTVLGAVVTFNFVLSSGDVVLAFYIY